MNEVYNFNFCKRLTDADGNKTFAYLDLPAVNGVSDTTRLTDGGRPVNVTAVLDSEDSGAKRHIAFELDGGEQCPTDLTRTYSVRYEITCDSSVTASP